MLLRFDSPTRYGGELWLEREAVEYVGAPQDVASYDGETFGMTEPFCVVRLRGGSVAFVKAADVDRLVGQ